jgi:DNA invertase Pin-like site-specific DNA recombinase
VWGGQPVAPHARSRKVIVKAGRVDQLATAKDADGDAAKQAKALKSFVLGCCKNVWQNRSMKTGVKIGYARVSTDGQTLAPQTDQLEAAGCMRIFSDHGASGAKTDRSGLNEALAHLSPGDILVVTKLDRLGRSLHFLIETMQALAERGVGFQSLSDGIDTTTSGGRLVFHIFGAIAEFERDLIQERTIAGLQAAKRRGKKLGRPKALSPEQVAHAKREIEAARETIGGMATILGVDRNTLARALADL